ncbi:hypothetical protein BABINDRAFT_5732 [Babjeviella inositovora NRRL Y-12698]|uniref:1-acyl-sn-glycerol-3-phosphate acyltransferase n=1 Tax=Babjeviella inositovora NRRL Y-12698 TaxID=984486 RepID=A0A1E3QYS8_9ASCO|nr:uncharacterized protein BABINDRAFT_5732 [Babjeviella inositovora NRRL Y-12698]ODQ82823.1 hypothetical protein BABINDRAFT_5732 [Babjeviella inositovora NRRL Y-12698]
MSFLKLLKFYSKTTLALSIFTVCAVYGVAASVVLTLVGKRHLAQWTVARAFYHMFSTCLGIRIRLVNGETLLQVLPSIILGNHQSALDILMLGRTFPKGCTVTSKRSLQYIPLLGWFMTLSGTFFIDRGNSTKARETLRKALDKLRANKQSVFIFPEGTRSYATEPEMLPLKKGAFHLAVQAGIPIVPLVMANTSKLINFKRKEFNRGEIVIEVLKPIETAGMTAEDVNKLAEATLTAMEECCKRLGYAGEKPKEEEPTSAKTSSFEASESTTLLSQ